MKIFCTIATPSNESRVIFVTKKTIIITCIPKVKAAANIVKKKKKYEIMKKMKKMKKKKICQLVY